VLEVADGPVAARCSTCGAAVLTACPACGAQIRGSVPGVIGFAYTPRDFCHGCGTPYPWASRQARLYELENVLEENDNLSDADALTVREQLEALRDNPDEDEAEQVKRWQRIKKVAPSLTDAGSKIFVSVTTAAIQKHMGL
jgi:hypothetical protein